MSKSERVILVSGSNGGIGADVVEYLFECGHRNIACQHRSSPDRIGRVLEKLGLDPARHLFQGDLRDENYLVRLQRDISEKLGDVAVIINLVGGSTNGLSWKLSLDDFNNVMAANLTTTFLTCRQFISGMREKAFGRIINVTSVVAFKGVAGAAHYCAAKAGIIGLTKALSLELANRNITANTLALGYFDTGMINQVPDEVQQKIKGDIPLGRFGAAREVAACINYLVGDDAGYVTGQVFHINGGLF